MSAYWTFVGLIDTDVIVVDASVDIAMISDDDDGKLTSDAVIEGACDVETKVIDAGTGDNVDESEVTLASKVLSVVGVGVTETFVRLPVAEAVLVVSLASTILFEMI